MSVTPKSRATVSGACVSFTNALLANRSAVVSPQQASGMGQALFAWFDSVGGLDEDKCDIAAQCVTIGIKALESSITTPQDAQQMIQTNYTLYAG